MTPSRNRRWEYRTLRPPRGETKKESEDPEAALNDCAAEGWELVETIDYTGGGTKFLVLARPVEATGEGGDADTDRGADARARDDPPDLREESP